MIHRGQPEDMLLLLIRGNISFHYEIIIKRTKILMEDSWRIREERVRERVRENVLMNGEREYNLAK